MGFEKRGMICLVGLALLATGCAHAPQPAAREDRPAAAEEIVIESSLDLAGLKTKVDRYAPVEIPFDPKLLSAEQRVAVEALVKAAKVLDDLFWEQASPHGPALRKRLASPDGPMEELLARYLAINYGAYDRLDDFEPFLIAKDSKGEVLTKQKPLGATFYPLDMTRNEWERHLEQHPADLEAFQSNFTVIRREAGKLTAVPYSVYYQKQLAKAAGLLLEAAEKVGNPSLSKYLKSRAAAFGSNDYFESDMDWMDVKDSPIEVTIGPYEVYEDRLFNYKAAFEAFITVRDAAESAKLAKVAGSLTEMERNLPIPDEHKNFDRGLSSPILVVDLIYSAGDTRAGVQTLAFNLPNDERVREKKGSKKVMLKNISHAKFDQILKPIAAKVLAADQLNRLSFDAYFNHTLMHEVSHGLGPGFIQKDGQRTTVNLLLKDLYSTIEEAKADVLGMYNTLFLVDRGVLPAELSRTALVTFLAGIFRSVRFGVHEAHGRANLIAFNYLLDGGAYLHDPATGTFRVDLKKAPGVIRSLAHDLLMIEAEGDYLAAKKMVAELGHLRPEMEAALKKLGDIPVDIVPEFEVE